ncbi:MAG: phosphate signaling complex protein PhoU [Clostridiaceae bacterium]|nr:phosphate signaling complex protein PhoU [Clostridiaceae bacterium]
MMRHNLDRSLQELKNEIGILGGLVEESVDKTIYALRELDVEVAQEVIERDNDIDNIENKIEKKCLSLFALQQPLAGDLRFIGSTLKMITDLERIGDHSADISELILRLKDKPVKINPDIYLMAEKARNMVGRSIDAFINQDVELATEVCRDDDEVDNFFNVLIMDIASQIKSETGSVEPLIDIMFIVKYLERIGDHATNISEWAVYNETGKHRHLQHPDNRKDLEKKDE